MSVEELSFDLQILNALAALLLLLSFAMLSQRRIVTLVNLLALQGSLLFIATLLLFAAASGLSALCVSLAALMALRFFIGMGLGGELPVAATMWPSVCLPMSAAAWWFCWRVSGPQAGCWRR